MYPLIINLKGKNCLVIGAGKTARRRIEDLIKEGAVITVVSPESRPDFLEGKDVTYIRKNYDILDLKNMFMSFACTSDYELNQQVITDSKEFGIFCSSVNRHSNAVPDFIVPSYAYNDNMTFAVSTNGISPALSASLRRIFEKEIFFYDEICDIHRTYRSKLKTSGMSPAERYSIMKKISSDAMLFLYKADGKDAYIRMADDIAEGRINYQKKDRKAIAVISFGTSYEDTRRKTIGAIEDRIREEHKDADVFRAFTSRIIMKKLDREGKHTDSVAEMLTRLYLMGYEEVYCQPTHIIPGDEYDFMLHDINMYSQVFSVLKTGRPLLCDNDDIGEVISALEPEFPAEKDSALILMGHGTSHISNSFYPYMQYELYESGAENVFVGTVEGYPELRHIIPKLKRKNIRKVRLLPFMIVAGDHAVNDMAGNDDTSWKNILEKEGYEVECVLKGLGENQNISKLFSKRISEIQQTM